MGEDPQDPNATSERKDPGRGSKDPRRGHKDLNAAQDGKWEGTERGPQSTPQWGHLIGNSNQDVKSTMSNLQCSPLGVCDACFDLAVVVVTLR